MDATIAVAVLSSVGVLGTAVVAAVGKHGENKTGRFNSVTDQIQEERDRLAERLDEVQRELVELHKQRHEDLVEIARLQIQIIQLEGRDPS